MSINVNSICHSLLHNRYFLLKVIIKEMTVKSGIDFNPPEQRKSS